MSTNAIQPKAVPTSSLCTKICQVATILVQMAIRVMFIVGSILLAQAYAPLAWKAAAEIVSAIGSTVLSCYFFPNGNQVYIQKSFELTPEMPRGLINSGVDCCFNAAVQHLESDPDIADLMRKDLGNLDMHDFTLFLYDNSVPDAVVDAFTSYLMHLDDETPKPWHLLKRFILQCPLEQKCRHKVYEFLMHNIENSLSLDAISANLVADKIPQTFIDAFNQFANQEETHTLDLSEYFCDFVLSENNPDYNVRQNYLNLMILQMALKPLLNAYDNALGANEKCVEAETSRLLRLAKNCIEPPGGPTNAERQRKAWGQQDASEIVQCILQWIMPPGNRIVTQTDNYFDTENKPPIADYPTGVREGELELLPVICLDMAEGVRSLTDLFDYYSRECPTEGRITRTIGGQTFEYPLICAKSRIVDIPKDLRIQIRRPKITVNGPQTILHSILPKCLTPNCWPEYDSKEIKNEEPLQIDTELDLGLGDGVRKHYELKSFIVHSGSFTSEESHGHYTAYRKVNNQWYYCDDESVRPVSFDAMNKDLSTKATLLHYAPA